MGEGECLSAMSAKKMELKARPLDRKSSKWDPLAYPDPAMAAQSQANESSGDPGKENFLQDVLQLANKLSGAQKPEDSQAQITTTSLETNKNATERLNQKETETSNIRPDLDAPELKAAQLAVQSVFKEPTSLLIQARAGSLQNLRPKITLAQWCAVLVAASFVGFSVFGLTQLDQIKKGTFGFFAKPITGSALTSFHTVVGYKGKNATYFQNMDRLLRNGEVVAVKKHLAKNRPSKIQTEEESLWARSLLARWELMQNAARKPSRLLERECNSSFTKLPPECLVHIRALIADGRNQEANLLIKAFWNLSLSEQGPASPQALRLMVAANQLNRTSSLMDLNALQDRVFEAKPYSAEAKIQVSKWILKGIGSAKEKNSSADVRKTVQSKRNDWLKFFESDSFRELSDPETLLLSQLR